MAPRDTNLPHDRNESATPLTTAEVRDSWNAYAADFEAWAEPMTTLLARSLLGALRLGEAHALVEVGAGAGGAAVVARALLPAGARQVVTDLSPTMVELARKKLPDADVREADAQALPFGDGTFDRLLANLNLMLVPDADRALAEAFRVLSPGGLAAWSVWGRPEESPMMTLPAEAAKAAGVPLPQPVRSNFYLGPSSAVVARVRKAGFAEVIAWNQPMLMAVKNGADYATQILQRSPRQRQALEGMSAEDRAHIHEALTQIADGWLAGGRPIGLDVIVVVARRP